MNTWIPEWHQCQHFRISPYVRGLKQTNQFRLAKTYPAGTPTVNASFSFRVPSETRRVLHSVCFLWCVHLLPPEKAPWRQALRKTSVGSLSQTDHWWAWRESYPAMLSFRTSWEAWRLLRAPIKQPTWAEKRAWINKPLLSALRKPSWNLPETFWDSM